MIRISIIGSGSVGWALAQGLEKAGHCVEEVWSRNPENAAALVDHLYSAEVQEHLDFTESLAEVFLLAVADKAVEEVAQQLLLPPNAILAHTSGTLPMELLSCASEQYGVFYPLQTFSKERQLSFEEIPFCLEAVDGETFQCLYNLACSLSSNVQALDSSKRKFLHLGAVFACNFTNHMLRISEEVLQEHSIDAHLLHPLIKETIEKSLKIGPSNAQTGPASRGDTQVMANHLEQLQPMPHWAELYYLISQDILRLKK